MNAEARTITLADVEYSWSSRRRETAAEAKSARDPAPSIDSRTARTLLDIFTPLMPGGRSTNASTDPPNILTGPSRRSSGILSPPIPAPDILSSIPGPSYWTSRALRTTSSQSTSRRGGAPL